MWVLRYILTIPSAIVGYRNLYGTQPEFYIKRDSSSTDILEIQPTLKTPYVFFKPNGNLLIQGRYIPEDITEFSDRLLEWVNNYIESPANQTILTLEFEYINDASKYLLILIKKLEKHCPDFIVDWIYEEGDTDMFVLGQIMNDSCQTDFNFISK